MADFPLRNILVPAVLVSSTVFSVLTLPVLNVRPTSVALNLPSFLGGNLQYSIFERGNKNLTIRYIGFVIMASAGSGIATAELVRKWHAQLEKKANLQHLAQQMHGSTPLVSEEEAQLSNSLSSDDLASEDLTLNQLALDQLDSIEPAFF
ncbi:MAG: hypothetical protein HC881_13110 [Leptolyngbyaceae cyanobacterium SL_7_1]|nr:hypothetical protein [Leptolyngbyaceae cyanobacterium SL_7_1]